MLLSVVIPTHNPHGERLDRTLAALRAQTLPASQWETILVNNASSPPVDAVAFKESSPSDLRLIQEPQLGLTFARRGGFAAARGQFLVLVDDDNVLAPDYLARVLAIFAREPRVGVVGGRSLPEFEREPADWVREFLPLLALRDLGPQEMISTGLRRPDRTRNEYPAFAPIGAGMALRRAAWTAWIDAAATAGATLSDRRGGELSSSGDNDIVLCAMRAGWEVGYFPQLKLTHLIPAARLDADYLARLNHGIQKSWVEVLMRHDACPWPPISRWTLPLRTGRAWLREQAWRSSAHRIRWRGICGRFQGQASLPTR